LKRTFAYEELNAAGTRHIAIEFLNIASVEELNHSLPGVWIYPEAVDYACHLIDSIKVE